MAPRLHPTSLVLALLGLAGCSFTTAGNFEECKHDVDCGTAAACSHGYCLGLPAGCQREEAGGSVKAFEQPSRIPLAALLPLTEDGVADDSERQGLRAMQLAVVEVNDAKGVRNRPFALFVCDTARLDETLTTQTQWMVKNLGVPAIVTSGSGQTTTAAKDPVRLDAGTLIISATATSAALISTFRTEGNTWRVAPPDTLQVRVMTNLLAADFPDAGGTRIDVVYESTEYGKAFANPLVDGLLARGYTSSGWNFDKKDLDTLSNVIAHLDNDRPRATVLIAFPKEAREIITRAKAFPSLTRAGGHRWYLTDANKDPALLTSATVPELDLSLGTAPAQGAGGAFRAFRDSFRNRYTIDPNSFSYTSHSYDALWLVMLATAAAQSTGELSGPRLGEGMRKLSSATQQPIPLQANNWTEASNNLLEGLAINAEGASSALDFDLDAGAPTAPYEVWQVSDGGIRVLRQTNP